MKTYIINIDTPDGTSITDYTFADSHNDAGRRARLKYPSTEPLFVSVAYTELAPGPLPKREVSFELGTLVATPGAVGALANSRGTLEGIAPFLKRHSQGDWGDVSEGDAKLNDEALLDGTRLMSSYKTLAGVKFWIITDAGRAVTTVLLPEEY